MLENAARICDGKFGNIFRWDGESLHLVATYNTPPAFFELRRRSPLRPSAENPIGRLVATKALVHVADLAAEQLYTEIRDPNAVAAVELGGIRTFVAVPMTKENELIGAIVVYRQEVRPFTDKQIALVTNFAAQAVIAIENARLLNELRQRTTDLGASLEQQTATSNVLEVISRSAFDLQAVFETVAESSVRLCGADRAFIFRFDGELLRMVVAYNASPEFAEWVANHPIRPGRHSGSARAALERRTIHITDVLADPEYVYGAKDVEAIRTILGVPILKGDDLLGVMMIYRLEVKPFTDGQIALVETFADQAAIAIENVRLLDELRERTAEWRN
jgi:GAF domain-containing protein